MADVVRRPLDFDGILGMPPTLAGALTETQAAYNQLEDLASNHGIAFRIANFGAVRTLADTNQILAYRQADFNAAVRAGQVSPDTSLNKFRPIAPFGTSFHNYGAAFDLLILQTPQGTAPDPNGDTPAPGADAALRLLGSLAPSLGLRWGGSFKNSDPRHFELAITLDQAKQAYAAEVGGGAVASDTDLSTLEYVGDIATADTGELSNTGTGGDVAYDDGSGSQTALLILGGVTLAFLLWWRGRS